jgi:Fe-S-cluster-containing dehydrogenase component
MENALIHRYRISGLYVRGFNPYGIKSRCGNVRSRGVIEKCSFCTQRIQEGKLTAKKENRTLKDGDIKTACQTACPTNAITFGDQNNKESFVAKTFDTNGRNYFVLRRTTLPYLLLDTKLK